MAFNTRKLDQLSVLLAPEFHFQDPMGAMTGRAATLAREQAIFDVFPDVSVEMDLGLGFRPIAETIRDEVDWIKVRGPV